MKFVLDESLKFEFLNINQLHREYHPICPYNPENQQRVLQKNVSKPDSDKHYKGNDSWSHIVTILSCHFSRQTV
jgi:hypothetical protein